MTDLSTETLQVTGYINGLRSAIVQLENDKLIDYELYMALEKNIKELSDKLEIVYSLITGEKTEFIFD